MQSVLLSISLIVIAAATTFNNGDKQNENYFFNYGEESNFLTIIQSEPIDEEYIRDYANNPKNHYLLFTRSNPFHEQILVTGNYFSILMSNFNVNDVTVFIVHGWNGHGRNAMNKLLTKAFLDDNNVNVIVVDWSDLANRNYITAKTGVPEVGKSLANFIQWLETLGASKRKMHLVGFSLGAHVIGNAGRNTTSPIERLTALDPGGPLWKSDRNRLVKTDARYVEVIHTNTALYGYGDPCGHADFYPNGGYRMPGCFLNYCSHSRSYEYMAITLKFNNFLANECYSLQDAFDDNCRGTLYPMGNSDLTKKRSGIFRVNTKILTFTSHEN